MSGFKSSEVQDALRVIDDAGRLLSQVEWIELCDEVSSYYNCCADAAHEVLHGTRRRVTTGEHKPEVLQFRHVDTGDRFEGGEGTVYLKIGLDHAVRLSEAVFHHPQAAAKRLPGPTDVSE